MSIELMSKVWKTALPSGQKMVLLALADNANDQGRSCFPSIKTLSEKCTTSIRAVQTHIALLEEAGLIARKVRINVTSEYVLKVKLIEDMATIEEARRKKEREETEWRILNSRRNFSTKPVDNLAVACGAESAPHHENDPESGWNPLNEACGAESASLVRESASLVPESASLVPESAPITTTEPSSNPNNNNGSVDGQYGCGDSEFLRLVWPVCSAEEKNAISGMLAALTTDKHQVLLDEVEGARATGSIKKGVVPFAGAIARAMRGGSFTPWHSPAVAKRRRERSEAGTREHAVRRAPVISADELKEGQKVLAKMLAGTAKAAAA